MRFSKREQRILGVTAFFVMVYAVYLGVCLPLVNKSRALEQQVDLTQRKLLSTQKTVQKSLSFAQQYQAVLKEFKQMEPDERLMASILSEIEKVSNQTNVRITDQKPRKPANFEFYNKFTVSLALEGELTDIIHFIHILQNPPSLFGIDEMRLDRKSLRASELRCQLVLSRTLIP